MICGMNDYEFIHHNYMCVLEKINIYWKAEVVCIYIMLQAVIVMMMS